MTVPAPTDCLVLGGGVIGLSLAYELSRRGAAVTVIDRRELGRESSWAGAGILPAARFLPGNPPRKQGTNDDAPHSLPRKQGQDGYDQLAGLSSELHPRWSEELRESTGIDNGYRHCGGVYLARTRDDVAATQQLAADLRRQEIPVRELDAAILADVEPALTTSANNLLAALHVPDEAQLRNPRHIQALIAACSKQNVTLRPGVECFDIERQQDHITGIVTNEGTLRAGAICITAGAWSGGLLARLGCSLPVKPIRGQIVLIRAEPRLLRGVVNEGKRYFVPRDDGRVLVGSTEEDAGFDPRTTTEGIAGLLAFATELCPPLAASPVEQTWAGLRPGSPDGRPFLGRVPGFDNLFCAAGHFRAGLHLSPGTAVVMSQLILGEPSQISLDSLAITRHASPV